MADGIVELDSLWAQSVGFTSQRFSAASYLWKNGDDVIVSLLESRHPGEGHFRDLVDAIEGSGRRVIVPTPLGHMQEILTHWGFVGTCEFDEMMGCDVEMWSRPTLPARRAR